MSTFRRFLIGDFAGSFGAQLSLIAVPTYAIEVMGMSVGGVSLIYLSQWLPPFLFGLAAGHFADRQGATRLMVAADLAAAAVAAVLVVGMLRRGLTTAALYPLLITAATAGCFYAVAAATIIPDVLPPPRRHQANARLAVSRAAAEATGQLVCSRLIGLAAGAGAVAADGVLRLVRAAVILRLSPGGLKAEAPPQGTGQRDTPGVFLLLLRERPILLQFLAAQGISSFAGAFIVAFFLVYAYRVLMVSPAQISLMLACGHIASTLGAMLSPRLTRAHGLWAMTRLFLCVSVAATWLLVVARFGPPVPLLLGYEALFSFSFAVFSVGLTTMRQNITPATLQGRAASMVSVFGYFAMISGSVMASLTTLSPERGVVVGCVLSTLSVLTVWAGATGRKEGEAVMAAELSQSD
ncbi:MFS transporter [Nitrospirillum sp. BR 11163]|uniref:MFS transporter n=1 Tax=Nitrospirillum sp. BR 11163 TaxID=3104323 RepID=UPI002AFF152A|nr:MFS transporter [Nitrospirillum sp. BR 11163]MEA1671952.1 MFS transporter [Nitrospirillum sp. BR 11163]